MKNIFTSFFSGILTVAAFTLCISSACKKNSSSASCWNVQLQRNYANVSCSTHCDYVHGCDGHVYCNACLAAKQGIYAQ
ncbi:MAG: hypothetical protein JSS82_00685 [Bacteroidetes bacterium]|nr:hypothetical protein [Bacteroidota bacterium]